MSSSKPPSPAGGQPWQFALPLLLLVVVFPLFHVLHCHTQFPLATEVMETVQPVDIRECQILTCLRRRIECDKAQIAAAPGSAQAHLLRVDCLRASSHYHAVARMPLAALRRSEGLPVSVDCCPQVPASR